MLPVGVRNLSAVVVAADAGGGGVSARPEDVVRQAEDVLIEAYWTPDDVAEWRDALAALVAERDALRQAVETPRQYDVLLGEWKARAEQAEEALALAYSSIDQLCARPGTCHPIRPRLQAVGSEEAAT